MSFEKLYLEPFLLPVFLFKWLPLFKNTRNQITPLPMKCLWLSANKYLTSWSVYLADSQVWRVCLHSSDWACINRTINMQPLGEKTEADWSTLTHCNRLWSFRLSWITSHRRREDKKGQLRVTITGMKHTLKMLCVIFSIIYCHKLNIIHTDMLYIA